MLRKIHIFKKKLYSLQNFFLVSNRDVVKGETPSARYIAIIDFQLH